MLLFSEWVTQFYQMKDIDIYILKGELCQSIGKTKYTYFVCSSLGLISGSVAVLFPWWAPLSHQSSGPPELPQKSSWM